MDSESVVVVDDDDDHQQPPLLTNNQEKEEERPIPSPRAGGGGGGAPPPNFIGKHRMTAAIAHLHQQIQIIQEELEQLETLGESSIVCQELVSSVESNPDALLPQTKGPADVGWDRWFQGAHSSRNRKRWI